MSEKEISFLGTINIFNTDTEIRGMIEEHISNICLIRLGFWVPFLVFEFNKKNYLNFMTNHQQITYE